MPPASPSPVIAASAPLRFGRFELQPRERRLLIEGQPATLGARAFDLLQTLAERPERLLTKNELLDIVWPGLVVEEANLHVQISALRKLLGGDVIATVPGRGYRFAMAVEAVTGPSTAQAAPPAPAPVAPALAVPPPLRLIGRDADLATVQQQLAAPGCLTLAGPAGVGKTSLARAALAAWAGPSVWVDLAPLADGSQVAGALARALGVVLAEGDAVPQLLPRLGAAHTLLALDNAEHLVEATAHLANALLQALPTLHLLVTSQMPLMLVQEQVQRLDPLQQVDDAVALLAERIHAADSRLRIEPAMLPLLQDICRQLDGLPLALEMAAARVPTLGVQGVRDALAQRFALLTRGHRVAAERHRTLHNALDWSYKLLGDEEQRLFRSLGVFGTGFTLELAVALHPERASWDVIDQLAVLTDRSLVTVSRDEPPRYGLLETMRAFALERLAAQHEEDAVRERHARLLLAMFARDGAVGAPRVAQCQAEIGNARDAMVWAHSRALLDIEAELAARVHRIATFTPWRADSGAWLFAQEPAMSGAVGAALPPRVQALWWSEFARSRILALDSARALTAAERAVALWRDLGDAVELNGALVACVRAGREPDAAFDRHCAELVAHSAAHPELPLRSRLAMQGALAVAADVRKDFQGMLQARLAEHALAREAGLKAQADAVDTAVVTALQLLGRFDEALARSQALLQRLQGNADDHNLPWAWRGNLAALLALDRLDEAQAALPAVLASMRRFDLPIVNHLVALLAARQGRVREAALLSGFALQAFEAQDISISWDVSDVLDEARRSAAAVLGAAVAAELLAQGRTLDADAAAALALALEPRSA